MAGIKYGVWQLHILLIGGIWGVGVWTLSRLIDFVTLLGLVDGFLLGLGYIVWVSSFTDTVVFSCIGGVRECFITGYPLLLFSSVERGVKSVIFLLSNQGWGFPGVAGVGGCVIRMQNERHKSSVEVKQLGRNKRFIRLSYAQIQGKGSISGRRVFFSLLDSRAVFLWH